MQLAEHDYLYLMETKCDADTLDPVHRDRLDNYQFATRAYTGRGSAWQTRPEMDYASLPLVVSPVATISVLYL